MPDAPQPDYTAPGKPTETFTTDQVLSYFVQDHQTKRNPTRPHLDLRMGTPRTGLFSWAVPDGQLPAAGEKKLAPQTNLHNFNYGQFSGALKGKGPGAGQVRLQDKGEAKIHKVTPRSLTFTLGNKEKPTKYMLVHMDTPRANEWLLIHKGPGGTTTETIQADSQEEAMAQVKTASLAEDVAAAAKKVDTNPTDAQIESGTYRKGHVTIQGLPISIENPKGSLRTGTSAGGVKWSTKMHSHYGYIKKTESGADGDHIDVFIGPHPNWRTLFIVNQNNSDGSFDEHKVMLGFRSAADAKAGYLANYDKGWTGCGSVVPIGIKAFTAWTQSGDTGKAYVKKAFTYRA